MKMYRTILMLMVAAGLIISVGCSSKADRAAQDILDLAMEAQEMQEEGEIQKSMEMMSQMLDAVQRLDAELKKMSPEQQEKFKAKWQKRFKEKVGRDIFGT